MEKDIPREKERDGETTHVSDSFKWRGWPLAISPGDRCHRAVSDLSAQLVHGSLLGSGAHGETSRHREYLRFYFYNHFR